MTEVLTSTFRRFFLPLLVTVIVIAVDQSSKFFISLSLEPGQKIEMISGLFNIVYIRNPGAAFGIMSEWGRFRIVFLIAVSIIALAVLFFFYRKHSKRILNIPVFMIAGGAIGNLIDRIRFGQVIDFLDFHAGRYHWPAFNVADAAITMGVLLTIVVLELGKKG